MNFKNFINSIRTLLLALVLSIGVSYAYAAWAPPSVAPTGGNTEAPVNVGGATQVKSGALTVNGLLTAVSKFTVGGSGTPPGGLTLGVAGNVGADKYCDKDGNNCTAAAALGGSGGIAGVTAGAGLTGGGTTGNVTLSADTNVLQHRLTNSCPTGAISAIDVNGSVVCQQNVVKHSGSDYCGGTGFMGFSATGGLVFPTTGLAWCPGYGGWRSDGCSAPDPQLAIVWVLCTQ